MPRLTRGRNLLAVLVLGLALAVGLGVPGARWLRAAASQGWDLDIDRAMDAAGIRPGMIVGEAGAGDGYFTIPMARRVGPSGVVYANDINERSLESLAAKASRDHLPNIHTVEGNIADPRFPRHDLELVVIVHAFHDFGQPVEWLVTLKKYLAPGGAVAIIDLDPDKGAPQHFLPRERVLEHVKKAGYEVTRLYDEIPRYVIVVAKPTANR